MPQAIPGNFVWFEHLTRRADDAVAFYTHVVGWTPQPWERGYTMLAGSQGPVGGVMALSDEALEKGVPPRWVADVYVADVDAAVAAAAKLGGRAIVQPTDVPKVGRYAVVGDPQGAVISVFKPNETTPLHDASKPGEFCWCELVTTDHEAAFTFYSRLFGWKKVRDFDMGAMGKYLVYGAGGPDLGGMFTKPKDMPAPPHWLCYVQVVGLDGAIERARSKGGKLVNGPMEVPGGARIAQLVDPQGAMFALHETKK